MFYLQFAIIIASLFSSLKITLFETDNAIISRDKYTVPNRKKVGIFLLCLNKEKSLPYSFLLHFTFNIFQWKQ